MTWLVLCAFAPGLGVLAGALAAVTTGKKIMSDAYIPVRIPDGIRPDGTVLAYLPDGTGIVVSADQVTYERKKA